MRTCLIEGCDRTPLSRGLCSAHYQQAWKAGRVADYAKQRAPAGSLNQEWRSKAACKGMDPDLFFPGQGESTREAKAICAQCPVQVECLETAMTNHESFGIWGRKSERERRVLRRTWPRSTTPVASAPCGTTAAYKVHTRRGETPCAECKAANARYRQDVERARVAELRATGMPNQGIAEIVGRSLKWVEAVITEDALPIRARGPRRNEHAA